MRIISSFNDIYDYATGWVDRSVVFVRETEEKMYDKEDVRFLIDITRSVSDRTNLFNDSLYAGDEIVFVMGEMFIVNKVNEEVFHKNNPRVLTTTFGKVWRQKSESELYNRDFRFVHDRFGAPVISYNLNGQYSSIIKIILNPPLKETKIGSVIDCGKLNQDIMQWVIEQQEIKGEYDFDDKIVRDSKGFDDNSFKHRK